MDSIGLPGSATYAVKLTGIEEMLTVLPDNNANQIVAQNVRDVVYTLYENIQAASFSEFVYTDTPSNVTVGGLVHPVTFASMSLFTLFNRMFHVDVLPTGTLKLSPAQLTLDFKDATNPAYRDSLGRDKLVSYQLTWRANKGTFDFVPGGIIERAPSPVPPEVTQPNDPLFTVAVLSNASSEDSTPTTSPILNVKNTYTFRCQDVKGNKVSPSVSVDYGLRQYIGLVSSRTFPLTSQEIRDLALPANNSGISLSGGFSPLKGQTILNHGGGNRYLCIATSQQIHSANNSGFTFLTVEWKEYQYMGLQTFTNSFNYSSDYHIYISISKYSSPIAKYSINP